MPVTEEKAVEILRRLSPFERCICWKMVDGYTHNAAIARELFTTEQVIKNALYRIYKKIGVEDRLQLGMLIVRNHHFEDLLRRTAQRDFLRRARYRKYGPAARWPEPDNEPVVF